MYLALFLIADAFLLVAIIIQLGYLRSLRNAGVEATRATKIVSYANVGLLVMIMIGLTVFGLITQLTSMGM